MASRIAEKPGIAPRPLLTTDTNSASVSNDELSAGPAPPEASGPWHCEQLSVNSRAPLATTDGSVIVGCCSLTTRMLSMNAITDAMSSAASTEAKPDIVPWPSLTTESNSAVGNVVLVRLGPTPPSASAPWHVAQLAA